MLIDAKQFTADTLRTHVCVIGSGLAATAVAKKLLASSQHDIVLIEAGDLSSLTSSVSHVNHGLDFKLPLTRSIEVGGTTNLWHGILAPLAAIDFQARSWIPKSGWPISLADLSVYYQQALQFFNIPKAYHDYFDANKNPYLAKYGDDIRFDHTLLQHKIYLQQNPIYRAKALIKSLFSQHPQSHCLYNATGLYVATADRDQQVQRLVVGLADGRQLTVNANYFVICCGALETPRLLLNSTRQQALPFISPVTGHYLMDHPMGNLCQMKFLCPTKAPLYSDLMLKSKTRLRTSLVFTDQLQQQQELPNHSFSLRPAFSPGIDDKSEQLKQALLTLRRRKLALKEMAYILSNFNTCAQIMHYKLSLKVKYKYSDLFFVTEQVPNYTSCVRLSNTLDQWHMPKALVNWQLSQQDYDSMLSSFKLLSQQAFSPQAYQFIHHIDELRWPERLSSAAHHLGSARMATSASQGVVDHNLQVFGYENLFVCDGSVFTTGGSANPSLTITALALRLGQHLSALLN